MITTGSNITVIVIVLAVVTITALTVGAAQKGERYQATAMANSRCETATFDPGYRTLMNNLYAGMR